ncbi:MAG: hypothetical protein AAF494_03910 [Pseudomonadota bacterium]
MMERPLIEHFLWTEDYRAWPVLSRGLTCFADALSKRRIGGSTRLAISYWDLAR